MPRQKSKHVPENLPEIDFARLAAFIDGEGHIGIGRCRELRDHNGRVNYKMWLCIANTDPRLMIWLRRFVVGNFYVHRSDRRGGRYPLYEWTVRSQEAVDLLSRLLPYFVMKRDQAELAIEFGRSLRDSRQGANGRYLPLPQDVIDARNSVIQNLKTLREVRGKDVLQ